MSNWKQVKSNILQIIKKGNKENNDLNFFYPYVGKKREKKDKRLYIITVSVVIIVYFLGSFIWNWVKINNLEKDIMETKKTMESAENKTKYSQAQKLKSKYDTLKKYYDGAYIIGTAINESEIIDSSFMAEIASVLPQSVSFKTMSIGKEGIQIQGTAGSRTSIAEFQHNLKELKDIEDVQVDSISKTERNTAEIVVDNNVSNGEKDYVFTLKCTLKDVD